MPERLIGAVLKTVERSRVPWVRIPPPPYKKQIDIRLICFLFCVREGLKPPSCGLRERAEAEVCILMSSLVGSKFLFVTLNLIQGLSQMVLDD